MSSEQVRPVIECFCQMLSLYGYSTISSEVFRLAKFDRNEATIPLWRLIYEMLYFDSNKAKQEFDQIPKDEIVDRIKRDLYKRGYTYEHFLSLDNQMKKGSRQLLVCVGWLIYHVKLIEKCMKRCLNSISTINETEEDENGEDDLIEQVKQAIRSNLKIRSRLRALEHVDFQENPHLSAFEIQLYQYPHLISQYLLELDEEHRNLKLFLFWNKHENIFWNWMESVLDQPPPPITTVENNAVSRGIDCRHLEAEKQKFNAAIDNLDSVLVRLEQLWISNDDHASIEQDVSTIISSIDAQISSLFNQLLNTNPILTIKSRSE